MDLKSIAPSSGGPSAEAALPAVAPPPRWAVWAAHAAPLVVLPSGVWRVAMAVGVPVGYSDQVLREEYAIPGWGLPMSSVSPS